MSKAKQNNIIWTVRPEEILEKSLPDFFGPRGALKGFVSWFPLPFHLVLKWRRSPPRCYVRACLVNIFRTCGSAVLCQYALWHLWHLFAWIDTLRLIRGTIPKSVTSDQLWSERFSEKHTLFRDSLFTRVYTHLIWLGPPPLVGTTKWLLVKPHYQMASGEMLDPEGPAQGQGVGKHGQTVPP